MTSLSPQSTDSSTVGVVIPTRDRPDMLRRAIDSVINQDYPGRIEVLVVFDGCEPEASLERELPRRRVKVIANSRQAGLAGARNSGILALATEFIAFCDDDDHWSSTKVGEQVAALAQAPAMVAVACGIRITYGQHQTVRTLPGTMVTLRDLIRSRLTELHPSGFLFRRQLLLDAVGLVAEDIPGSYGEDYELLLRCARVHPIGYVRKPLVEVTWHPKSFFSGRWETIAAALTWLLGRYPEFTHQPAGKARISGQIAFAHAAMGSRREALRWVWRTSRLNPGEARAPLALAVAAGMVSADRVVATLNRWGRGI